MVRAWLDEMGGVLCMAEPMSSWYVTWEKGAHVHHLFLAIAVQKGLNCAVASQLLQAALGWLEVESFLLKMECF